MYRYIRYTKALGRWTTSYLVRLVLNRDVVTDVFRVSHTELATETEEDETWGTEGWLKRHQVQGLTQKACS